MKGWDIKYKEDNSMDKEWIDDDGYTKLLLYITECTISLSIVSLYDDSPHISFFGNLVQSKIK